MTAVKAPVKAGDVVGQVVYELNGNVIGTIDIVSDENVEEAKFADYIKRMLTKMLPN